MLSVLCVSTNIYLTDFNFLFSFTTHLTKSPDDNDWRQSLSLVSFAHEREWNCKTTTRCTHKDTKEDKNKRMSFVAICKRRRQFIIIILRVAGTFERPINWQLHCWLDTIYIHILCRSLLSLLRPYSCYCPLHSAIFLGSILWHSAFWALVQMCAQRKSHGMSTRTNMQRQEQQQKNGNKNSKRK